MTTINNLTIEQMKEIVSKAPSNAESYQGGYYFRESPQFIFHNGFHDQWNLTDNDGLYFKAAGFHPVRIDDLRTAIAEHDLKQCQHGYDIACLICGFGNENGVRVWRNQIESDEVTDIRNHLSPSTVVVDLVVLDHPLTRDRLIQFPPDGSLLSLAIKNGDWSCRHADPEEIKAGHRLEAERHG